MRAVVQRVSSARVTVGGDTVGAISKGLLVFLGVAAEDTEADALRMADKLVELRVFAHGENTGEDGKMNLSVVDVKGAVLLVSQFTLFGDCRKGRRPSFEGAAPREKALTLFMRAVERVRERGVPVETGSFGEMMHVALVNDGPVTLSLDTRAPA